jgi:hypothetical protein
MLLVIVIVGAILATYVSGFISSKVKPKGL